MIVELPAEEGEVEPGDAGGLGHREVGVVGHVLVDIAGERRGGGLRRRALEQGDGLAVLWPGLEHLRLAAAASGLHVDDEADVLGQRMITEEAHGAQQPGLLPIGDGQHHVPGGRPLRLQQAHDLQGGGHPRRVVGGARRGRHAVIVGHQRQGWGGAVAAGQHAHDVLHRGAQHEGLGGAGRALNGQGPLHLGLEAHGLHPPHQIVADHRIGRRTHRVRNPGDHPVVHHGAAGGELLGRGLGAQGCGGLGPPPGEGEAADHGQGQGQSLVHGRRLPSALIAGRFSWFRRVNQRPSASDRGNQNARR